MTATADAATTAGLTLALNAAEGVLQMAFADEAGRFLYGQQIHAVSRGVEVLTPALNAAFMLLGKKPGDIARVAVVRGPGSFTGLRLTATTAAGLARSVGATQAGLEYMDILARECRPSLDATDPDALLWILVRARRDLVYIRSYLRDRSAPSGIRAVTGLDVLPVAPENDAAMRILETSAQMGTSRVLLAGSGFDANRERFARSLAAPGAPRVTGVNVSAPGAETLLEAALDAAYGTGDIEPLYVRPSDAEENLPRIAERLGLDPDAAVRQLHVLTHARFGSERAADGSAFPREDA